MMGTERCELHNKMKKNKGSKNNYNNIQIMDPILAWIARPWQDRHPLDSSHPDEGRSLEGGRRTVQEGSRNDQNSAIGDREARGRRKSLRNDKSLFLRRFSVNPKQTLWTPRKHNRRRECRSSALELA